MGGPVWDKSLPSLAPGAGAVKEHGGPPGLRMPEVRDKVVVTYPIHSIRKEPHRAA